MIYEYRKNYSKLPKSLGDTRDSNENKNHF